MSKIISFISFKLILRSLLLSLRIDKVFRFFVPILASYLKNPTFHCFCERDKTRLLCGTCWKQLYNEDQETRRCPTCNCEVIESRCLVLERILAGVNILARVQECFPEANFRIGDIGDIETYNAPLPPIIFLPFNSVQVLPSACVQL